MHKELSYLQFRGKFSKGQTTFFDYEYANSRIFILSSKASRNLITYPELIGIDVQNSLFQATADFLSFSKDNNILGNINIFNILRGGLNFPLEKACATLKSVVPTVSFVSSERITIKDEISLKINYKKLIPVSNASIIIGDIIASGNTLRYAVEYMLEYYSSCSVTPKNIIVFTIGTYNTLTTILELNKLLCSRWGSFEGIIPVFYEAIFNVYSDSGITGLNTKGLDFYLADAFVVPQLRAAYIDRWSALFEKCAIYDGGDRRFNPEAHMRLICDYWYKLASTSSYGVGEFLIEKIGYDNNITFNEWLEQNGYKEHDYGVDLRTVYQKELKMIESTLNSDFILFCNTRLNQLKQFYNERAGYSYEQI